MNFKGADIRIWPIKKIPSTSTSTSSDGDGQLAAMEKQFRAKLQGREMKLMENHPFLEKIAAYRKNLNDPDKKVRYHLDGFILSKFL